MTGESGDARRRRRMVPAQEKQEHQMEQEN